METSTGTYMVYITISDGYIYHAEVASWSNGVITFTKKLNDSRPNRPVGSYIVAKNVKECGTLLFSSFKDKTFGHSLGRLDGPTLTDINYIKTFQQGIDGLLDANYVIGLTDFIDCGLNK